MTNTDQEVTPTKSAPVEVDRVDTLEEFQGRPVIVADYWSGPLPSPETMADYNDVIPDGANRIVTAWEKESEHRRLMELEGLRSFTRIKLVRSSYAIFFASLALAVTAFCAYIGSPWVASILGGGVIASVVIAFLHEPKGDEPVEPDEEQEEG